MRQIILGVVLAIGIGAALVVSSGILAVAGADCLRDDTPSNQIP
jgi:hypothetical protein